jgi:hypothetical protein
LTAAPPSLAPQLQPEAPRGEYYFLAKISITILANHSSILMQPFNACQSHLPSLQPLSTNQQALLNFSQLEEICFLCGGDRADFMSGRQILTPQSRKMLVGDSSRNDFCSFSRMHAIGDFHL